MGWGQLDINMKIMKLELYLMLQLYFIKLKSFWTAEEQPS
jgi:hypothetical protein